MRVLVIGATGTIGTAVAAALEARDHEVVRVGHSGGDVRVDLSDPVSIDRLHDEVGAVDAVVCTAGLAQFGALRELTDDGFALGIASKMMGQVNLVRSGLERLAEGASFTLTTGTLTIRPTPGSSSVAMVGGGVEAFVRAAALDLAGEYRINAVSPGWVAESRVAMGLDPMPGIWARDLAEYYVRCVEGDDSGLVLIAESALEDS